MSFKELVLKDPAYAFIVFANLATLWVNEEDEEDEDKDEQEIVYNPNKEYVSTSSLICSIDNEEYDSDLVIDGITIACVSEGERYDGNEFEVVYALMEGDKTLAYVSFSGYYSSWGDNDYDSAVIHVAPVQRLVTFYEEVK